jgi:hypothetical protein
VSMARASSARSGVLWFEKVLSIEFITVNLFRILHL